MAGVCTRQSEQAYYTLRREKTVSPDHCTAISCSAVTRYSFRQRKRIQPYALSTSKRHFSNVSSFRDAILLQLAARFAAPTTN